MVFPVVKAFKSQIANPSSSTMNSRIRLPLLAELLYCFMKVRGSKTIGMDLRFIIQLICRNKISVRFFPHQIEDLTIALNYLLAQNIRCWEMRYILLLWLSLICMIPFDLARFDEVGTGSTFDKLEDVAKTNVAKAGLEKGAAAYLLARLYARYITITGRVKSF